MVIHNDKHITAEYLNNLLLEVTHTMDSMRILISHQTQQRILKFQTNRELKEIIDQEVQTEKLSLKNCTEDHNQSTNDKKLIKSSINNEVSMLVELIQNIFKKLDDPSYKCENEECQLLRDRQKLDYIKDTRKDLKGQNIPDISKIQQGLATQKPKTENVSNSKESHKTNNKDNLKKIIPNSKEKKNIPNSRPLVTNLKADPSCKDECGEKIKIALLNNKSLCSCSPIEEFYRNQGCSYINYRGRILVISCPND